MQCIFKYTTIQAFLPVCPSLTSYCMYHGSKFKDHPQRIFRIKLNNVVGLLGRQNFSLPNQHLRETWLCHLVTEAAGSIVEHLIPQLLLWKKWEPALEGQIEPDSVLRQPSTSLPREKSMLGSKNSETRWILLTSNHSLTDRCTLWLPLIPRLQLVFLLASSGRNLLSYSSLI